MSSATLSPDGKWLAYPAEDSGQYQVYLQAFPSSGGRWQVSSQGGTRPKWSRDGTELYYVPANDAIMAVRIRTNGAKIENDTPRELLVLGGQFPVVYSPYDVAPDGRFLMLEEVASAAASRPLRVIDNWQAGLKK